MQDRIFNFNPSKYRTQILNPDKIEEDEYYNENIENHINDFISSVDVGQPRQGNKIESLFNTDDRIFAEEDTYDENMPTQHVKVKRKVSNFLVESWKSNIDSEKRKQKTKFQSLSSKNLPTLSILSSLSNKDVRKGINKNLFNRDNPYNLTISELSEKNLHNEF